jgi:hypothetical protein
MVRDLNPTPYFCPQAQMGFNIKDFKTAELIFPELSIQKPEEIINQ